MSNVRVKYIGTADRFSEVGITGQQQVWQRGEAGFVSDTNAALLVASGQFAVAEAPRAQLVIDASGSTAGILDPATGNTIALGGGGGGGGGSALPTISAQTSVSVSITAAAAPATSNAFAAFPSQACTELLIANRTGVEIEYTRNGTTFMSIRPGATRRVVGITDASQISVRRSDWNDLTNNTTRTSTVTATAITGTETFSGAAILNVSVISGGGGNSAPAYACTAAEVVNNTGKDMQYRVSPATAFVRIPAGASEMIFGITNTSQILFQPYDNVADAARPVMIEAFTAGLRERLNQNQPASMVSANARILLGDMQYPSKQPTGPNLSVAEAARGPRRTLVPSRIMPLAQFSTVANMVGATAQCVDVADGDLYLGTTQVEFTQPSSGTYNFMPSTTLATGVDVSQGIIRITLSFPKGTPDYSTSYSLTALRVQLFSSGSASAVPADYHQSGFGVGEVVAAKLISYNKRTCSYSFDISTFAAVGSGANLSAITWARFQLAGGSSGNNAKFRPVSIEYVPKTLSKAIVIFTVDDFNTGAWTGLLPMLSKYGYPAVLFGDSFVNLGNTGNLSAEQVRILHQHYGWQVANQNFYRETSTYDNSEQLIQEHSKYALIMQALGISNLEDTSFGTGTWDNFRDDNMPAVRRMFRTATLFMNGANATPPFPYGETAPFGDPYRIRRLNMSSFTGGTALQRFKEHVDQAVNSKGVAIFGAHTEFNPANMAGEVATNTPALLDYIRAYELNNQVEVLTLAQAIEKIYPRA